MAKKLTFDAPLLTVTLLLLGFGLVMVWSASSVIAQEKFGNGYHYVIRQGLWGVIGLIGMAIMMRIDYRSLRKPLAIYALIGFASVMLIVVLFLKPINDVHRWIRIGGMSFQPAEFAKLTLIIFLAYHIDRRVQRINEFLPSIFPASLLLAWFAFLVFIQPDLGSAVAIVGVGAMLLFLAGVRMRYFAIAGGVGLLALTQAILLAAYRRERIGAFLNPWSDPRGSGYQIIQSLIAVGTGGVTGVGLMDGRQKQFYLPYPASDFVYAVICEELGLLGAVGVLLAFLFLLWRGLKTAWNAPDTFGMFLAAGITLAIVMQAFINISVVVGLLPTKGLPLPLISAGGSSLVLTLLGIGLVLNVSQHTD
ncbi:MAG: putative lipid II flippase FtsW [Vicinamibacteria bacterium]|nr:putative lipid II flippase FtsW [Vicinamibacteria bacterium]